MMGRVSPTATTVRWLPRREPSRARCSRRVGRRRARRHHQRDQRTRPVAARSERRVDDRAGGGDEDANIIFGAVVDPTLTGKVKITVIATGSSVRADMCAR